MSKIGLSKKIIKKIELAIDMLFARAKARILGPQSLPKQLKFKTNLIYTIPGVFTAASKEGGADPDKKTLFTLLRGVGSFIDGYNSSAKALTIKKIDAFLKDASRKGIDTDWKTVLGGQLAEVNQKITSNMQRLIDTEVQTAKNTGALNSIVKVSSNMGVEDPVVMFIVVRDSKLCDECKRLHLMPDGITPRLWYMRELDSGYHKKGEQFPSVNGIHPNCRCQLSQLHQGFGFDSGGRVKYIGLKYNAIEEQRKLNKTESVVRPWPDRHHDLITKVRSVLTQDLLKPQYRGHPNPVHGHCYNACNALYYLLQEKEPGWKPVPIQHEGGSHWYLKNVDTNEVIDPTHDQFHSHVDYASGKPRGWVPTVKGVLPTKAALEIIDRVRKLNKTELLEKYMPEGIENFKVLSEKANAKRRTKPEKYPADYVPHPKVTEHILNAPVAINFPTESFHKLLQSGRWKNLGVTGSGLGETDQGVRKEEEKRVFGLDEKVPWEQRPVYGGLHIAHGLKGVESYGPARSYGQMFAILKPHVNDRTTFTKDDSFSTSIDGKNFGHIYLDKHRDELAKHWLPQEGFFNGGLHLSNYYDQGSPITKPLAGYIEAQIWGGIDLSNDISEIHLTPDFDQGPVPYMDLTSLEEKNQIKNDLLNFAKKNKIKVVHHKNIKPTGNSHHLGNTIESTVLYDPTTAQT